MHGETTPVGAVELWQHIFGDERGLLSICHGNGQDFKTTFFNYPDSSQQAAEFSQEKAQADRNVWFCCHLLTTARRIKENTTAIRTLWADLDGAKVPNEDLAPTVVVRSSPDKFHCYWRLVDPIPPETAEELNKRLALAVGADPSGSDLTQLLRVPGTVNHKYPEKPAVEIIHLEPDLAHTAGELDTRLPKQESWTGDAQSIEDVIADGSRNKTLTSIAGTLRRRGLDADSICAALLGINSQKCDPPLSEIEVAQIAKSVARYAPAERNSHSHSRIGNVNVNVNEEENPTNNHPKKHLRAISFAGREKPPPQKFVVEKVVPRTLATSFYGGGGLAN